METADTAPTLSSKQKAKTIRSKVKKPTLKTNLCNPYSLKWPVVPTQDAEYVLRELKRQFSDVDLRKSADKLRGDRTEFKAFKRMNSQEKDAFIKKMDNERPPVEINLRTQVVCGFQAVMKCLERDGLRLVLVSRDCWDIIKHLAQITCVRGCPGMAVQGLSTCVAPLLGVSSLSALGFKKTSKDDSALFDDLVQNISSRCPPMTLPWLDLEQDLQEIKDSTCVDSDSADEPMDDQSVTDSKDNEESTCDTGMRLAGRPKDDVESTPKDYSHLYIYKRDLPPPPPIVFVEEGVERITASKELEGSMDFLAFEEDNDSKVEASNHPHKRKRDKSASTKLANRKKSKSNYQSMTVAKLQANSNRKSGKTK